ncbi:hypothetical protein WJX73_005613 [Symbiochloris irregularis]|uniref:Uncharacterized protein n=1 Tax=Symbiochloris irregularis TaxID=706552 RepID=A0AAW1PWX5_9CHLO
MNFLDRKTSEQLLHQCEMDQKRAAAELFFSFTSQLTAFQHARMEVTCQPYRSDPLKLCEAVEQSLVGESLQAALEQSNLQARITEAAALADAGGSGRDASLLGDAMLDDILGDFAASLPAGGAAGPARQNSWELQDLSVGLDLGVAQELLGVLN